MASIVRPERKKLNARKEVALEGDIAPASVQEGSVATGSGQDGVVQEQSAGTRRPASSSERSSNKVITRKIKVKEDELKAYYTMHAKEFQVRRR